MAFLKTPVVVGQELVLDKVVEHSPILVALKVNSLLSKMRFKVVVPNRKSFTLIQKKFIDEKSLVVVLPTYDMCNKTICVRDQGLIEVYIDRSGTAVDIAGNRYVRIGTEEKGYLWSLAKNCNPFLQVTWQVSQGGTLIAENWSLSEFSTMFPGWKVSFE